MDINTHCKRIFSLFFILNTVPIPIIAQTLHPTGCIVDSAEYYSIPRVKEQTTRGYEILPTRYSLQKYCPKAQSQQEYSTCTAWATAYAARTTIEAVRQNWTDNEVITREAFSPAFIYAQIRPSYTRNCDEGTSIPKALAKMKNRGVVKFRSLRWQCVERLDEKLFEEAKDYKLDSYSRLFDYNHVKSKGQKVASVKKSISENRPVVVAMWVPESFHDNTSEHWRSKLDDSRPSLFENNWHAMCVVAYDDSKYHGDGGFLLMNSWGDDWGKNGFAWVSYSDFFTYVREAYEVTMNPIPVPLPTPQPSPKPLPSPSPIPVLKMFSSGLELQHHSGETMNVTKGLSEDFVTYRLSENLLSGMNFRIYLSNERPAYVYVISSDKSSNLERIFPSNELTRAALTYRTNLIAIPDEQHCIHVGDELGTNYLCFLYSSEELDIDSIITVVKQTSGTFYQKLKRALGNKMVPKENIIANREEIRFSATSNYSVVPLVVEINVK